MGLRSEQVLSLLRVVGDGANVAFLWLTRKEKEPLITLYVNHNYTSKPEVANPKMIESHLDQPNRKLLIFSGTACPGWRVNDDGHTSQEEVTVNLRYTVLAVEQATVTVGLASFGNDDSVFLIAADSAQMDIDSISQELLLKVSIALQGDDTGLMRFGYQAVAVVTTQATGISGTIRWSRDIFASPDPALVPQMFQITANHVERVTPPQGFAFDKYTPIASGVTTGFSNVGNDFAVPYEIPGAPYNQPLVVTVTVGPLFQCTGTPVAGQTNGANPVVLTVSQPGVTDVDFRVSTIVIH